MSLSPTRRRTDSGNGTVILRHKDKSALHRLLLRACPPNENGEKSITVLARRLRMSSWGVHKWCNANRIPPLRARDIVDIADPESGVTLSDFAPFVYA